MATRAAVKSKRPKITAGSGSGGSGKRRRHDGFGADAIHVREVLGQVRRYDDREGEALPGFAVEVINNRINKTADDGVQVVWSGNTRVHNNKIKNVGKVVEDYIEEYEEYQEYYGGGSGSGGYGKKFYKTLRRLQDDHGADGIHVHSGFFKYGLPGYEHDNPDIRSENFGGGGKDYDPYFLRTYVEITENKIGKLDEETGETSKGPSDDGIETEGITDLLIADNKVYDSGDDGIRVLGYAGFLANEEKDCFDCEEYPEEIDFGGGSGGSGARFEVVIVGNEVIDSGTPDEEGEDPEGPEPDTIGFGGSGKKGKHGGIGVEYYGEAHGDGIEITGYDRAEVLNNHVEK